MRRERSLLSLSLVLYVGALMLESLIICNTSYASEISGDWATQGNAAHVRIERCTAVQDQFCGVVTWLWEPIDSHGEPIRDARNPDMRLRDRPLMGLTL